MTNEINAPRQNSGLAIVSLVSGVLGVTLLPFLGSIVAVITAPMAKNEIRESDGMLAGEDMAKIGQILGWVGIALFGFALCCCAIIFAIPILVALGIIVEQSTTIYWLVPGLAGLIF